MLASINPLGERSRNRTWRATFAWYLAGSTLGGALMGALMGALGSAVDAVLAPSSLAVAVTALALGIVGLVFELHPWGLALPTVRRQVDEDWLGRYRAWVYAGGFGFQLGLGVVTVVTTATVYVTWAFAALTGSVAGGLVIGLTFGIVRALPILVVAHADTPGDLRSALRRFAGWAPAARTLSMVASGIVPVLALALVWSAS